MYHIKKSTLTDYMGVYMKEIKRCPVCKARMENGAIISSRTMFWGDPEKSRFIFIVPDGEEEFNLTNSVGINTLHGYICKECGVIQVQYYDLNNR